MSQPFSEDTNDLIDLRELFASFLKNKYKIILITSFFSLITVFYAINLPNIYISKAVLSPSSQTANESISLGSYSRLAGLAGIKTQNGNTFTTDEALERIKSYDFFANYFLPKINSKNLYDVKSWNRNSDKFFYNNEDLPTKQKLHSEYLKILSYSRNQDSGFVTVSIKHQSPYIAKKWVLLIIDQINLSMLAIDRKTSEKAISFLNDQAQTAKLTELKEVISQLLMTQMQTLMMASIDEEYIFKIISSPVASENRFQPNRKLIVILGFISGLFISLFIVTFDQLNSYRNNITKMNAT